MGKGKIPGGGDLFIETEKIALDEVRAGAGGREAGWYVKVNVTDTGVGMDEKTRERVFDPFFTTKGMGWGSGLGLATVYGIIKGHKGIINVYRVSPVVALPSRCIYQPQREEQTEERKEAGGVVGGGLRPSFWLMTRRLFSMSAGTCWSRWNIASMRWEAVRMRWIFTERGTRR
jgi:signal transduction histidine kinase